MNWARSLRSRAPCAIGGSARWPDMSRKKRYSHAFVFTGATRSWSGSRCASRTAAASGRAPDLVPAGERIEVLSSRGDGRLLPEDDDRVKLFMLSWIRFRIAFSRRSWPPPPRRSPPPPGRPPRAPRARRALDVEDGTREGSFEPAAHWRWRADGSRPSSRGRCRP